ncbi:DDE-type integrase/transposase/recombinase [Legionella rowbothamii]|uniref:DDE-type integrase/transposase/recombinase n=1 Tax=Legionella rowbothamii TaxID=96229 RepID=UPI0010551120|nr:DDE-type integrase/transposase/recombinase [Legionella rowbothamii]
MDFPKRSGIGVAPDGHCKEVSNGSHERDDALRATKILATFAPMLDEQQLRIRGVTYYLWCAVDDEGYELDVFLQKRRNKGGDNPLSVPPIERLSQAPGYHNGQAKELFEARSSDVQRSRTSLVLGAQ